MFMLGDRLPCASVCYRFPNAWLGGLLESKSSQHVNPNACSLPRAEMCDRGGSPQLVAGKDSHTSCYCGLWSQGVESCRACFCHGLN
jgi:hypothetical protein